MSDDDTIQPPAPRVLSLVERRPPVDDPWSPLEMLEEFVADVKSGKVQPANLAIHWCERTERGGLRPNVVFANMDATEAVAFGQLQTQMALERWKN
jgi:hypothetical protein